MTVKFINIHMTVKLINIPMKVQFIVITTDDSTIHYYTYDIMFWTEWFHNSLLPVTPKTLDDNLKL